MVAYTHHSTDQARHDKAIGIHGQSFDKIISTPRFNSHLLENDVRSMRLHLDKAKAHYMIGEDASKGKQVFSEEYSSDTSECERFFARLQEKVASLLLHFSTGKDS